MSITTTRSTLSNILFSGIVALAFTGCSLPYFLGGAASPESFQRTDTGDTGDTGDAFDTGDAVDTGVEASSHIVTTEVGFDDR